MPKPFKHLVGFQKNYAAATLYGNQMRLPCNEDDNGLSGLEDHTNTAQILYGKCVFLFGGADKDIVHRYIEFL